MARTHEPFLADGIQHGHYARKQLFSRSRIISWSHSARFRLARRLVEPFRGGRLLDYGCGDGTFLAMTRNDFAELRGADINPHATAEAAARLGTATLKFCSTLDLKNDPGGYDVITCMETLEHVHETDMPAILGDLARLVRPGGAVVISVPIEIGPTLWLKQAVRRVAGWRGLGDYKWNERYSTMELIRGMLASEHTRIARHEVRFDFPPGLTVSGYGHRGFNYKALRTQVRQYMQVTRTAFSPLGWTRGLLSSQAWFICQRRA